MHDKCIFVKKYFELFLDNSHMFRRAQCERTALENERRKTGLKYSVDIIKVILQFEIAADDPERTSKFYQDVFGWKNQKWAGPID